MNDSPDNQSELFPSDSHTQLVKVLYIPAYGPPRHEDRTVVGAVSDNSAVTKLIPKTTKHEVVSHKDDGTVIINGP